MGFAIKVLLGDLATCRMPLYRSDPRVRSWRISDLDVSAGEFPLRVASNC